MGGCLEKNLRIEIEEWLFVVDDERKEEEKTRCKMFWKVKREKRGEYKYEYNIYDIMLLLLWFISIHHCDRRR